MPLNGIIGPPAMAARLTAILVVVIVGTTLIAGLIVGAQRDDNSGPVDLIIHNAKVYGGDSRQQDSQGRQRA
jgi:hypothetical protein